MYISKDMLIPISIGIILYKCLICIQPFVPFLLKTPYFQGGTFERLPVKHLFLSSFTPAISTVHFRELDVAPECFC